MTCYVDDDVAESHGVCNKRGKEHDWGMDEEVKAAIAEYMEDYHSLRAKAYKFGSN